MNTEAEALIELIAAQTKRLLADRWRDIDSCRDGESTITLTLTHKLTYEGSSRTVKTSISFSHRVKDEIEETLDTAQTELPLRGQGEVNAQ